MVNGNRSNVTCHDTQVVTFKAVINTILTNKDLKRIQRKNTSVIELQVFK